MDLYLKVTFIFPLDPGYGSYIPLPYPIDAPAPFIRITILISISNSHLQILPERDESGQLCSFGQDTAAKWWCHQSPLSALELRKARFSH